MITLGWAAQHRSTAILFTIFLYFSSFNICSAAQIVVKEAGAVIDFSKKFITDTLNLDYMTSQEIVVGIPGTEQELVINWGFGGSGHMLSPLPWVPAQLRSTKSKATSPFSIADLGKALLQDKVGQQAKQLSVLKWLTDGQLSPLKLCVVKIFLLAKDVQQQNLDVSQVQLELVRLLVRLSLTDDRGIISSSKPFSTCIPKFIRKLVDKHIPGALDAMDSVLETLLIDSQSNSTGIEKKLARTVYAFERTYKDDTSANDHFMLCKAKPIKHFMQGKDIVQFDEVSITHTPANMPQELKDAALAADKLPQLIIAKTAGGQHWIGCVTDRIDITKTATLTCAALLATVKEYAVIRKAHLAQHPEEALKAKSNQEAAQQQRRRLHAFAKTNAGMASYVRLEKELGAVKNAPKQNAAELKAQQDQEHVQEIVQELNLLKDKEQAMINRLAILNQSMKNAPSATKAAMQKRAMLLSKSIEEIAAEIEDKETLISMLAPQAEDEEQTADQDLDNDIQNLKELRDLVDSINKNGEAIPAELTSMIQDLEEKIQAAQAEPQDVVSLDERLALREEIALVYRQEARLLKAEVAQRLAEIESIAQATKRRVEEIRFSTLEKPLFDAYIASLNEKADLIINQNTKMFDLDAYRQAITSINSADIPAQDKAKIRALELEVGILLDRHDADLATNSSSKRAPFYALLLGNPEISQLLRDLSEDNKIYAATKERLFNRLGLIIQKSDHVKMNAATYHYLIEKSFPDFLPLFNHVIKETA